MIRTFLVLLLTTTALFSYSQQEKIITLRTTPLSLIEHDAGIMLGVGYKWNRNWSAALDPTYVFFAPLDNDFNTDPIKRKGLKIRADVRYHLRAQVKGKWGAFLSPEVHFKNINTYRWTTFGINCFGGNCAYYQYAEYRQIRKELGGGVKFGTEVPLTPKFIMEVYAGLGLKQIHFQEKDIPTGGSFLEVPERDQMFGGGGDKIMQSYLPMGVKFALQINKQK